MTTPTEEEYLAAHIHAHRKAKREEAEAMRDEIRLLTILLGRYQRGEIVHGLFAAPQLQCS